MSLIGFSPKTVDDALHDVVNSLNTFNKLAEKQANNSEVIKEEILEKTRQLNESEIERKRAVKAGLVFGGIMDSINDISDVE